MYIRGDQVEILPEFRDEGDDTFNWIVPNDEEKARIDMSLVDIRLSIKPIFTVQTFQIKEPKRVFDLGFRNDYAIPSWFTSQYHVRMRIDIAHLNSLNRNSFTEDSILADVHNPTVRSKNMRAVRSKDTRPELLVRKALHMRGLRYRLHVKTLPGCPDIVFPRYKAVVLVNGCFWHGHHCHLSITPKTRTEFWLGKISNNMSRDRIAQGQLLDAGWRLGVVWECAIKGRTKQNLDSVIDELENWLYDPASLGIEISGKV